MKNPIQICCKKNSKSKGSMEKLDAQIEHNRVIQERKHQQTQRNIQILREDLYLGIMKPFFGAG